MRERELKTRLTKAELAELRMAKREAKKAARGLFYKKVMPDVMDRISSCTCISEVNRIMATCRNML